MDDDNTFISHLVELRARLIRALLVLFLGFLPCAFFARELYSFLAFPLLEKLPQGGQMIATEVVTPFFIPMKVALMVAFLVTLPHTLYQIWAFVAPGLYSHEKRLFLPLVFISSLLFFTGMAFAYFAVLPLVFEFIVYFAPEGVAVMTDISEYLNFVLSMFLAFGITFEVPVFVLILIRTGLVSIEKMRSIRRFVLVGAFVIGAIFTPPDVMSQILLAIPLYLLYELGILFAALLMKQSTRESVSSTMQHQRDNTGKNE
ncbi:Sec-independent protein translocase TatC [Nitrosomonas eutropha]|uniref:Sec-independent protein translocase protein TatC n=1 Tax=Nitrosomonas eutropha TaxID=916 RepID=A0A1I7EZA2_9PROT|nr:twin-arginine translocase subunit TatC [Nitrosomonas eutropha]SFU29231.1 Sec-independent protein translocase TatC [Nitrosomonas eutropha]